MWPYCGHRSQLSFLNYKRGIREFLPPVYDNPKILKYKSDVFKYNLLNGIWNITSLLPRFKNMQCFNLKHLTFKVPNLVWYYKRDRFEKFYSNLGFIFLESSYAIVLNTISKFLKKQGAYNSLVTFSSAIQYLTSSVTDCTADLIRKYRVGFFSVVLWGKYLWNYIYLFI